MQYICLEVIFMSKIKNESKDLSFMTQHPSPALNQIWDNDKDADYDKL